MKMDKTTRQELFEVLYTIEDIEYDTELGKRVSKLLNTLEKTFDKWDIEDKEELMCKPKNK